MAKVAKQSYAPNLTLRSKREVRKSPLSLEAAKAKEEGLSYGALQAQNFAKLVKIKRHGY